MARTKMKIVGLGNRMQGVSKKNGKPYDFQPISFVYKDQYTKNNRILCCTAQVFTRVNKGLREQVSMVYNPHTFLGCFTVVIKRKPIFDSEGNVIESKYRGMYSFVHTEELRSAYDTYKVIHTLAKEGFKDMPMTNVTNVYVDAGGKRK